jgi:competence protein ComEC
MALQWCADLPDIRWAGAGLLLGPAIYFFPVIRIPACFALGFLWTLFQAGAVLSHSLPPELEGETVQVEGRVVGLPRVFEDGVRFDLEVSALRAWQRDWPSPGRIRLNWREYPSVPIPGESWRFYVRLKQPHGFINPGGFDYEGWLFQHGIRATGYVLKSRHNIRLIEPTGEFTDRLRQSLQNRLGKILEGTGQGGVIVALAIGAQEGIPQDQWRVFNRTGTSHLIAISGLHVGLVAGLGYFLGRWIWSLFGSAALMLAAPRMGAVAGFLAAFGYSALAGFSIPTERTLIMIAVVAAGVFSNRRISPIDLLLAALWLVLLWEPFAVMSAGFWLSFTAVAVILYGMAGRVKLHGLWWSVGKVHWVVGLGLMPLLLLLFGQNPTLGPVANLAAVPWVSFGVVPLVLLGLLFLPLSEAAGILCLQWAERMMSWLWPYLEWLSDQTFATWNPPPPEPWVAVAALVGVLILLMPRGLPGRGLGLIWLLPVACQQPSRPDAGEFWFTLLDVGQGLSAVVHTEGHVLVYDAGPRFSDSFDAGRAAVVPYLRHHGIDEVDTVVISHGDNDHIGGLEGLLDEIPASAILTSVPNQVRSPKAKPCQDGQHWRWDGVDFEMLNPPPGSFGKENDQSCVLRVSTGDLSVLLPGDIEWRGEERLLQSHVNNLQARVLVAPHHGSKTSSSPAFIDAVAPDYVLFPVGYGNRFGFPRPEILDRYSHGKSVLMKVSETGAIQFRAGDRRVGPVRYREIARRYWHQR